MRKEEFIKQLEYLLQDIPDEEKEDAIAYYQDYLEEAGPENEEKVIRDFGSPERIAAIIRSDLSGNLRDGGEFTEKGYEDERFREPNFQLAKRLDLPEKVNLSKKPNKTGNRKQDDGDSKDQKKAESRSSLEQEEHQRGYGYGFQPKEPPERRNLKESRRRWAWWQILGMIFLACCAVPAVVPLVFGIGGGAIGIFSVLVVFVIAIMIALAALTVMFLLAGILLTIFSFTQMANPVQGFLALGTGIGILGVGFIFFALCGIYYGKFLPWLFRMIINSMSRLLHRKEVSA